MEEKQTEKAATTLSKSTIYAYGLFGQSSRSPYLTFQAYYLLFFMTSILEIPAYLAAILYTSAQWVKAATMLLSGIVIDATCPKWGKYNSWLAIGAIILLLTFGTTFYNFNLPLFWSIVVFAIFFTLQAFGYNLMWTSTRGVMGLMSKNSSDAIALAAGMSQVGAIVGIINGTVSVSILAFFTERFAENGYAATGFSYALLIFLCTFFGLLRVTKPYDEMPGALISIEGVAKPQKIKFIDMLKSIKGPLTPYFLSYCFCNARSGFFFALLAYFTTYMLKNPLVLGYSLTLQSVGNLVGSFLIRWVEKHIGKKRAYIGGMLVESVLYIMTAYIGRTAIGFLICRTSIAIVTSCFGAFGVVFANDIADYKEMNGEVAARGFIQSVSGTTVRIGAVMSTTISSFGLAALGYVSGTVPSENVLNAIVNLMAFGPAVFGVIASVIFIFYKVDEKALDQYREKREAAKKAALTQTQA